MKKNELNFKARA